MIRGYITLKQAADISGKNIEALKKQCQEGRIRGAIKQGNAWFVPHGEIVVDSHAVANGTLNFLITMVEAGGAGTSFGITLFVNGAVVGGDLISRREYISHFEDSMLKKINVQGLMGESDFHTKFSEFTKQYFNKLRENDEQGMPTFIHLKNIQSQSVANDEVVNNALLRIKTDSIDGFILGRIVAE